MTGRSRVSLCASGTDCRLNWASAFVGSTKALVVSCSEPFPGSSEATVAWWHMAQVTPSAARELMGRLMPSLRAW